MPTQQALVSRRNSSRLRIGSASGIGYERSLAQAAAIHERALIVEAGGIVRGPVGQIAGLGSTLTLTFKPRGSAGLSEEGMRRYGMGPAWESSDPTMTAIVASMRLVAFEVTLA